MGSRRYSVEGDRLECQLFAGYDPHSYGDQPLIYEVLVCEGSFRTFPDRPSVMAARCELYVVPIFRNGEQTYRRLERRRRLARRATSFASARPEAAQRLRGVA